MPSKEWGFISQSLGVVSFLTCVLCLSTELSTSTALMMTTSVYINSHIYK